ncbi:MAG: flagellar filament capping protein FliD [Sedimentibacter sp.]
MSSLSTSLYGSTTNKGVGGLLSGLDTDDLVKQMTAATRNKINRQYQSKQKLLYKQEAYREISTKLLSFSDKYFSYASGSKTNILSPKFFESYTFESSSDYVNVTGNAENIKNFEINSIDSVATAASFSSSKKVTSGIITSDDITKYTSSLAGETFSIKLDGNTYNLSLSNDLGKNKISGGLEREVWFNDIVVDLNKQLAEIKDKDGNLINSDNSLLKYKLDGTVEGQYKIILDTSEGRQTAELTAASTDFLNVLKMKVGSEASSTDFMVREDLTRTAKDVMLAGNITFEYNGVLKTVNLSEMNAKNLDGTDMYTYDADGLKSFLQNKFNAEFGSGKITVGTVDNDANGQKELSFTVAGDTNVFGISSISKELSYFTGLESGDYNRLNKNKTLMELGFTSDNYQIKINDTTIDFKNTMTMTDVINTINSNAEAGVNVYYSSTTDTFTVKATETGEHKSVTIIDMNGGNLATSLFGSSVHSDLEEGEYLKIDSDDESYINYTVYDKDNAVIGTAVYDKTNKQYSIDYIDPLAVDILNKSADYIVESGTDTKMSYTLNGITNEITRSTANFTIDEINIELNEKASTIDFTNSVTFDVTNNSDEVVERVKQFITDYNEIINLIGTKTSEKPNRDYLPLSPEQQDEMEEEEIKNWTAEAKKGVLYSDSKMNNVLRNMKGAMSGLTDVSSITLSSIGISSANMDTSGKLVLDEAKFKEKLLENPDEIANLFTLTSSNTGTDAKSGISIQLQKILRDNVGAYGTSGLLIEEAGMSNSLTSDKNFISERIEEYDDKMAELKVDLEAERKRYWNQFSALEQSLNKLNVQSSWLTDMMGQ